MIQYAIYQSKANNYTKGKFYARAIHTDIVDLEGIAEHMCRHNCSYSRARSSVCWTTWWDASERSASTATL